MKKYFPFLLLLVPLILWADTTTPRLGLTVPTLSSPYWGSKINTDLQIIDANVALNTGNTTYIQNTNSLQSGATYFVSSGTVQGQFNVYPDLGQFFRVDPTLGMIYCSPGCTKNINIDPNFGPTASAFQQNGLGIQDVSTNYGVFFGVGSTLTNNRTLTLTTGDTNRTVTLTGSPTLGDWFNQSLKTTDAPTFSSATITNALVIGSTIAMQGAVINNYKLTTASYTATLSDHYIESTTTSTLQIRLPSAAAITAGLSYWIVNTGTGTTSVLPFGSELINGATIQFLRSQYEDIYIWSNGANWRGRTSQ